jgi:hypothetical protein
MVLKYLFYFFRLRLKNAEYINSAKNKDEIVLLFNY